MNGPMASMPNKLANNGRAQSPLKLLMVEFPVTYNVVERDWVMKLDASILEYWYRSFSPRRWFVM